MNSWKHMVLSNVATDTLALKHQAINIHSLDKIALVLDQFFYSNITFAMYKIRNKFTFREK